MAHVELAQVGKVSLSIDIVIPIPPIQERIKAIHIALAIVVAILELIRELEIHVTRQRLRIADTRLNIPRSRRALIEAVRVDTRRRATRVSLLIVVHVIDAPRVAPRSRIATAEVERDVTPRHKQTAVDLETGISIVAITARERLREIVIDYKVLISIVGKRMLPSLAVPHLLPRHRLRKRVRHILIRVLVVSHRLTLSAAPALRVGVIRAEDDISHRVGHPLQAEMRPQIHTHRSTV